MGEKIFSFLPVPEGAEQAKACLTRPFPCLKAGEGKYYFFSV
jgi:hypothetical protein